MSRKVILVVDDESTNVTIVANILSELYDIKVATSGQVALEILEKEKVDLILLDVIMPAMSGYEVASKILENQRTQSIPIIFLTALTTPENIKEGFEKGAVDYISKPFSKEELHARVSTHLRINSLQKSLSQTVSNLNDQMLEVEKNKKEFEAIFNYSNDGIAILDLDSKFLNFNKAYLEMTGFTEEELYKITCIDLTAPEDRERSEELFELVLTTEDVKNFEKTCIVHDNVRIKANMSISLLPDKARFLLVVKDVSKIKEQEEHARNVSLHELIGNIAHQWRQPLSVISTVASGIKVKKEYGLLEEKNIIENMDMIVDQTNYLSSTIEDFSHLVRLDTEREKISLVQMTTELISLVEASLKYSSIILETHFEDDMIIECYKGEVIQALINIINNARDSIVTNSSKNQKKYLLLSIVKNGHNSIELKIIDSGGGIVNSVKNRIFEPYFTTKHQSVGTGIGLSTAYKILHEKHNCKIEVYNKEFMINDTKLIGACFSIIFPGLMI